MSIKDAENLKKEAISVLLKYKTIEGLQWLIDKSSVLPPLRITAIEGQKYNYKIDYGYSFQINSNNYELLLVGGKCQLYVNDDLVFRGIYGKNTGKGKGHTYEPFVHLDVIKRTPRIRWFDYAQLNTPFVSLAKLAEWVEEIPNFVSLEKERIKKEKENEERVEEEIQEKEIRENFLLGQYQEKQAYDKSIKQSEPAPTSLKKPSEKEFLQNLSRHKNLIIGLGGMGGNFLRFTEEQNVQDFCLLEVDYDFSITRKKPVLNSSKAFTLALTEDELLKTFWLFGVCSEILKMTKNTFVVCNVGGLTTGKFILNFMEFLNSQELQLTLCINTPFDFEGPNKVWRARKIIQSLENKKFKHTIFNNEDLFKMAGRETTYQKAFEAMNHKILGSIFDRMKKIDNS